jgi:hypothetical protein
MKCLLERADDAVDRGGRLTPAFSRHRDPFAVASSKYGSMTRSACSSP